MSCQECVEAVRLAVGLSLLSMSVVSLQLICGAARKLRLRRDLRRLRAGVLTKDEEDWLNRRCEESARLLCGSDRIGDE